MSEKNGGVVVPFALPVHRMRQAAAGYLKRRMPVEAVELYRQALEKEDSPALRLDLAEALADLQCYEQASNLLYPMLRRADAPIETWLLLARCNLALGREEGATDCLYHLLALDPYSDLADTARDMLGDMEDETLGSAPRLSKLESRANDAWLNDDWPLARRRMRRAIKLTAHPALLRLSLASLEWDGLRPTRKAYNQLALALKEEPNSPQVISSLCMALDKMGRHRMACGYLNRLAALCDTAALEQLFFTTARILNAWGAARRYFMKRLRRAPCRVALMHPLAVLLCEKGDVETARKLWERALRLCPEDELARLYLRRLNETPPRLPRHGWIRMREDGFAIIAPLLARIQAGESGDDLFVPGSESRHQLDWCFAQRVFDGQKVVLAALCTLTGDAVRDYLRQLLTLPTVEPSLREQIVLHLYDTGYTEPLPILTGQRMGLAQPVDKNKPPRRWPMFLFLLLQETREVHEAAPLVAFAAERWREMTETQRARATDEDSYAYVKAVELSYLRQTGQADREARVRARLQVSPRRVERILSKLTTQGAHAPKGDDKA